LDWERELELLRADSDRLSNNLSATQARLATAEAERRHLLHKNSALTEKARVLERKCALLESQLNEARKRNDKLVLLKHNSTINEHQSAADGDSGEIRMGPTRNANPVVRRSANARPPVTKDNFNLLVEKRYYPVNGLGSASTDQPKPVACTPNDEAAEADIVFPQDRGKYNLNEFSPDPKPPLRNPSRKPLNLRPNLNLLL
jgi:hypothetical protein